MTQGVLLKIKEVALPSEDFERFYESCFGNSFGIVCDGVDKKTLLNLTGDEREEAEKLLLESLGQAKILTADRLLHSVC
jgi:hypothetical protein